MDDVFSHAVQQFHETHPMSLGLCRPKIIKIGSILTELFKKHKTRTFSDDACTHTSHKMFNGQTERACNAHRLTQSPCCRRCLAGVSQLHSAIRHTLATLQPNHTYNM